MGIRTLPICFIAAAITATAAITPAASTEPVDLELVLAADGSGSIDEDEFRFQREGYASAIQSDAVLNAIKSGRHRAIALAFVEWAAPESVHTIVDWMIIRGPEDARKFAVQLLAAPRIAYGFNSISEAIAHSMALIETNDIEGRRKVIDISGDGPQINGRPLPIIRAAALNAGITINALVVNRPGGVRPGPDGGPLTDHYSRDVIGGFGAFMMTVEGRERMAGAVRRKMVLEIADANPTGGSGPQTASMPSESVSETN
jgi:uncharacterized protein DUF1194